MSLPSSIDRALIEGLVRETLRKELSARGSGAKPELLVNVSARHMHVTQEELEILFGKGHQLKVHKWLYQEGQFAAEETVTLIGPRKRIIPNLRILGPCRTLTQIELAYTDALQLGIDVPVRHSGDIAGTTGGWVMGPKGMIEMKQGIIRAARHVHMSPADAETFGVRHKDMMKLRIVAPACTTTFEDLLVRVDKSFKLEVHIDTDEGNSCNLDNAISMELLK
ncbi:MAG: phosphate propanoyltransferase [Verrucomicrobiae bacterium]|nr:phosphate propanoyltransferase [Verrucomicrobiae bacterium]